jgi:hypothetical protein
MSLRRIASTLPLAFALLLVTGCALQPSLPYKFYPGETVPSASLSLVKPARSFGGPAVGIRSVDGTHVLDYDSMRGYPKDSYEAARLEPQAIQVRPGTHSFSIYFTFTDVTNKVQMVTLLSLVGAAPVSMSTFRKTADIQFTSSPSRTYFIRYNWDESKGAAGIKFYVDECTSDSGPCKVIGAKVTNELSEILPGAQDAQKLLAR